MENQDLVNTLKNKIHKLSYIHQVSHAINSMESEDDLLAYTLNEALRSLESESGSIFVWNEDSKELELILSKGPTAHELKGIKKKLGDGIAGIVARDGKPILVKNIDEDPRFQNTKASGTRYKTRSFICVPLIAKNRLIGVINVTEKLTLQPFNDDELEFLFIIANHAAIALDNIQLYKKVKSFNQILQTRIDEATEKLQQIVEESVMLRIYKENILESLKKGIFVVDSKGCITLWNRGMELQYNITRDKALNQNVSDILALFGAHSVIEAIQKVLADQSSIFLEKIKHTIKPDKTRIVNYNVFPLFASNKEDQLGVVVLHDDITEKIELEKELRITERLALIGKMASGIAHELNNPLDGTRRYLNLGLDQLSDQAHLNPQLAYEYFTSAKDGVNRMINIVRSLLDFSRQTSYVPGKLVNINEVINDAIQVVKMKQPLSNIHIKTNLAESIPYVFDCGLQSIFTNLFKNAIDAMPHGGNLDIYTFFNQSDPDFVFISVTDTGVGICDSIKDKIFDPFFTTKAANEGTGLGLALCQEIIKRIEGSIDFTSILGKGSTFTIKLPCNQKSKYR
jgi:PAS domain S-box-containing protein